MSKILVVDDEPDAIAFVRTVLEENDHEVLSAPDGESGITQAQSEHPDLIVLDVQMPKKDGFHVFGELRRNEQTRNIPVLMLTAIADRTGIGFDGKSMAEYIGSEPDAYIDKPVDPDKLRETVARLLS